MIARLVFSSVLYNNLKHNNNINPITYPLNITFEKLASILRPGFIQGEKHFVYPSKVLYDCSSFTYLACHHSCGKIGKKVNGFMDELELEHDCEVQTDLESDTNQIKSNQ